MARTFDVRRVGLLAAALAALGAGSASAAPPALELEVLSNRADLVSAGDALVAVDLAPGVSADGLRVRLGRRDVTGAFAKRASGRVEGLVEGLADGRNVLTATLPGGRGARLEVTNHPNGGPVFSGPQLQPWTCQPTAVDRQCNEPPKVRFLYQPRGRSLLEPYDPASPPSDVATTTTDTGATVPFIVRSEVGYQDRSRYRIDSLFQPGTTWDRFAPPRSYNGKVLVMHGGSCGTAYRPTDPPFTDYSGTLDGVGTPDSSVVALGRGFTVMATALANSGVNCNPALQAESIMMAKERVVERLGDVRYVIGTGCSGGSLAQLWIANAYPGLYDGLITQCTFPDAGSTAQQIMDYALLANFLGVPISGPGTGDVGGVPLNTVIGVVAPRRAGWTTAHVAAIAGDGVLNLPVGANWGVSAAAYFGLAAPDDRCPGIERDEVYDAQHRPGGVRCGIIDWAMNLLGPRDPAVWSPQERAAGRGFAGLPVDNVGVQYGLGALRGGRITPEQFVELNEAIGGLDVDFRPRAARTVADRPALANAYRTGIVNQADHLDRVPIINLAGPNDPGLAHDSYRAFALRERLVREHGTAANQVMWQGPVPIVGDLHYTAQALVAMDRWLGAVQADRSDRTLAQKVRANRPADVRDQCSNGNGTKVADGLCGPVVVPVYGTPRTIAGEPLSTDQNKCRLRPLSSSDYRASFTASQWRRLERAFPEGVCDWSARGVDQVPTVPWLRYGDARGKAVFGGEPLGAPAPSRSCKDLRALRVTLPSRWLRTATVTVNGARVKRLRGKGLRRAVRLSRFPDGTVRVRVAGRTKGGKRVAKTRRFEVCRAR
ncbi:DUF6351 family protein [Conexibacter sp. SYSU D00693]|uniref:DUF6351 family protein n=1 Tax=Conexibacter sp. SYSU D00693 TaxID=2812560 RepID=UPI00196B2970|nr:DUF6351 family protein [Conexibacter sp. SYSU D00693]